MIRSIITLALALSATANPIAVRSHSYPINTDALNCRSGPSTSHAVKKTYHSGSKVTLTCQTSGENVNGDSIWGKTSDGCYVADYYVSTGTSGYVMDKCGGSSGGSSGSSKGGYPVNADTLHCRSGAGTSHAVKKSYHRGDKVTISCQAAGESVNGNSIWDKTSDGCYVSDYYVKTGSSGYVTKKCSGGSGGGNGGSSGGHSSVGGSISRDEIISRGEYWIKQHVPYSMYSQHPDPQGRDYRTDCSGFVSMALHATQSYSTVTLPAIAKQISWSDLKPGDFVGTLGSGTGGSGGHVTLFKSWANSSKTKYNTLECKGKAWGCIASQRNVGWTDNGRTAKPYRYIHVK